MLAFSVITSNLHYVPCSDNLPLFFSSNLNDSVLKRFGFHGDL